MISGSANVHTVVTTCTVEEGVTVSKARAARKIAAAAAYGGGGLGVLGGALWAILGLQAILAKRAIGPANGEPPYADGIYGSGDGEPISLVLLGDSTACGYGVTEPEDTPGAMLAMGLSALAERPVRLTCVAVVGAETRHLQPQVERAMVADPDVAVIIIGANDVTHLTRPADSVRLLDGVVRQFRAAGAEVVVGTCPDLGTVEPLATPLRQLARAWSRRLAAAQTIGVVEAGGRTVSLGSLLGPEFEAAPGELFGPDRFHPSSTGYMSAVAALLPAVAAALGYWPDDEEAPDGSDGSGVLPISFAAVRAAKAEGTEVAAATVAGHERGPQGRWARMRRHPAAGPDRERSTAESTTVTANDPATEHAAVRTNPPK